MAEFLIEYHGVLCFLMGMAAGGALVAVAITIRLDQLEQGNGKNQNV